MPTEQLNREDVELLPDLDLGKPVNTQLYENSPLAGSPIEAEAKSHPLALHGQKLPNFAIINEKPEHRLIVFYKARGMSNRAIAKKTGYSEPWVSQIVRQPWFQVRLMEDMKGEAEDYKGFMRSQVEMSLLTLAQLRDTASSESVRLGATCRILDQFLGKPVQKVESNEKPLSEQEKELRTLEAEFTELDLEEKRLLAEGEASGGGCAPEANG